ELEEAWLESHALWVGDEVQQVAGKEPAAAYAGRVRLDAATVAVERDVVEQVREVDACGERQGERADEARVDLEEMRSPVPRIGAPLDHREAAPFERLEQARRRGDQIRIDHALAERARPSADRELAQSPVHERRAQLAGEVEQTRDAKRRCARRDPFLG